MSCSSSIRTLVIARRAVVFSGGSTSNSLFFPLSSEEMESIAPMLDAMRVTIIVETATAGAKVAGAFRTSDDGTSWSTPTSLSAFVTGVGRLTGNWTGSPNDFKRLVQVGVDVQNVSGTVFEQALVTVMLDLRMQS